MPLCWDNAGYVRVPLALISKVIDIVSTLPSFDHDLCVLSQQLTYAGISLGNRIVLADETFIEDLREALGRIQQQHRGVFNDLRLVFEEIQDLMERNVQTEAAAEN